MKLFIASILLLQSFLQAQTETDSAATDHYYPLSVVALFAHSGVTDARVFKLRKQQFGALENDLFYLAGGMMLLGAALWSAHNYKGGDFLQTTFGSALIGSVVWDLVFSHLRYNDALYPIDNWFAGWGFGSKAERIAFDLIRITAGILLLIL
ncbi:MAG: hypothetical protein Kow0098_03750 [Ignavibacteriaceae bacterium]